MLVLDLAGTFAFGLSGGLVGVRARLDLFGIIVLAGVVGLVGGITQRHPPGVAAAGHIQRLAVSRDGSGRRSRRVLRSPHAGSVLPSSGLVCPPIQRVLVALKPILARVVRPLALPCLLWLRFSLDTQRSAPPVDGEVGEVF
jgi:hypothetical protein